MGKLTTDSMLGKMNGKVGPVVVSRWKGIDVVKSAGPRNRNNNSAGQIEQKARFSVASELVRHLAGLFSVTYKLKAKKMTARNSALGQIVSEAIIGQYPDFTLDYTKVMVSKGTLEPAAATVAAAGGQITWTWTPNIGINGASELDQAFIVAYCPERKQSLYLINSSTRISGTATLNVQPFVGLTVFTYMGFTSLDQSKVSDSRFTGQLLVS